MNKQNYIIKQIQVSVRLIEGLRAQTENIVRVADVLVDAFKRNNQLYLFGNGGSAADAQHIACELHGKFYKYRNPLPATALTTNTSIITSIANDYSYAEVFSRQVKAMVRRGDVAIGISTSGNSPSVLKAISKAKNLGAITIAMTGKGGKLRKRAVYVLTVPSGDTPRIQEVHIMLGHMLCSLVEDALFGDKKI